LHPHADVLAWLEPLFDLEELIKFLQNHLNEELPVSIAKGNVIKEGVSEELDRLRNLQSKGRGFLDEMCQREIERTGLQALKLILITFSDIILKSEIPIKIKFR
jgi:DNA mismatch repair protein MutS